MPGKAKKNCQHSSTIRLVVPFGYYDLTLIFYDIVHNNIIHRVLLQNKLILFLKNEKKLQYFTCYPTMIVP